jgi:tetratricopeptide (TPR) repeat protein
VRSAAARAAPALVLLLAAGCLFGGSEKDATPPPTRVEELNAQGLRRLGRGDVAAAEKFFERARREAELIDDLAGQAAAWNNLGAVAMARGAPEEALADHDRALALHGYGGASAGRARTQLNRGGALLALRRTDEAGQAFGAARAIYAKLEAPSGVARAEVGLAAIALTRGSAGEAEAAADRALAALSEAKEKSDAESPSEGDLATRAAALSVQGKARARRGDLAGARRRFTEALAIDRDREASDAVAGDLRALAEIAERTGDLAAAADYLERVARLEKQRGEPRAAERDLARIMRLGATRRDDAMVVGAAEEIAALRTPPAKPADAGAKEGKDGKAGQP